MVTRALLILSLLIVTIAPSPATGAQAPDVCTPGARHAVYLPYVAGGDIVPKSDILKRIDENAAGLNLTDVDVFDASEKTAPDAPSGISLHAVEGAILILVDFNIDTAHLHSRFRNFNVWVRPFGSDIEDDTAFLAGTFSDSDFLWAPPDGGYTGWEVSLSAVTNTEVESSRSAWQRIFISTVYDDFSDYGGDQVTDTESLSWLEIATFDSDEDWTTIFGTFTTERSNVKEGNAALRGASFAGLGSKAELAKTLDLSQDSRFTDDDYVCISVYLSSNNFTVVNVGFANATGGYEHNFTELSTGWNYLKAKKSEFTTFGAGADWANITLIGMYAYETGSGYAIFDDWRIVKASPSDSTTFSDTGDDWIATDGTWHVYSGFRISEPFYNCSLGQIESGGADDFFITRQNVEMPNNKASVGVLFRDGGRAGLTFRLADDTLGSEDALAVELDADANTLYLVRYATGVKSTLASTSYTPSMLAWLGVDFRDPNNEGRIKVYAANTQWDLFTSSALRISHTTAAPWPDGRAVGLVAHDCNVRFVEYRAGSTQTADYAHKAGHALTAGYSVEDYGAAVARRVDLGATVAVWSWASVQRSTGNAYDSSGQGRTLSYHGNLVYNRLANGTPYINLDGTGDYFSRSNETDLSVTGTESILDSDIRGLTLIGWFYVGSTDNATLMGKANDTDGPYFLYSQAGTAPLFRVRNSGDTTNYSVAGASTVGAWHFIAGVYVPGDRLALRVNDTTTENTTSIPASILSAGDNFAIGGDGAGGTLFTGYVGLCSLHFCNVADEVIERLYQSELALYG